jgi:hypothetical protein
VPTSDPWLSRQNAALKLIGHGFTLDVAGARVRLRATMPPRPTDPLGAEPKQYRISTGLAYPDQATESLQLAEQLGNALERHRLGLETFTGRPGCPRDASGSRLSRTTSPKVSADSRRSALPASGEANSGAAAHPRKTAGRWSTTPRWRPCWRSAPCGPSTWWRW